MAILSIQKPVLSTSGTAFTLASATSAGDSFPNTGSEYFHVLNSASAAKTITFDSPGTCNFGLAADASHDLAVVVPPVASAPNNRVIVGPFPTPRFNDGNARVQITYSDASGVTVAAQGAQ